MVDEQPWWLIEHLPLYAAAWDEARADAEEAAMERARRDAERGAR